MKYLEVKFAGSSEERLDKILLKECLRTPAWQAMTRSQIKQAIEGGNVTVNSQVVEKAGFPVKAGARVRLQVEAKVTEDLQPYEFDLDVVFEDKFLLVINKPAGLTVHPGAGNPNQTLVNALISKTKLGKSKEHFRPGIVHRLDKDTSGLVVVAKDTATLNFLSEQFAKKTAKRYYYGLVLTMPRGRHLLDFNDSGRIEAAIGRSPSDRKSMAVVEGGRHAVTNFKVIERYPHASLVEFQLETGRTHQIRAHLKHVGNPLIGDRQYSDMQPLPVPLRRAADKFGHQALHAFKLEFIHPNKRKRSFKAKPPADFQSLLEIFKNET